MISFEKIEKEEFLGKIKEIIPENTLSVSEEIDGTAFIQTSAQTCCQENTVLHTDILHFG
jgi:hypothetical protein